ncbi:MAG TPA: hypothetical protein VGR07_15490 [Thermoanaerobaculia bacterium]|nr:hypothetical protein [Thermoanaerobaculia bacterium]
MEPGDLLFEGFDLLDEKRGEGFAQEGAVQGIELRLGNGDRMRTVT